MQACNYCERRYNPLDKRSAPDAVVFFYRHEKTPRDQRAEARHFCRPDCLWYWLNGNMPQTSRSDRQPVESTKVAPDTTPPPLGDWRANQAPLMRAVRMLVGSLGRVQRLGSVMPAEIRQQYLDVLAELDRVENQEAQSKFGKQLDQDIRSILVRYVGSVKGLMACLAEFGGKPDENPLKYCQEHYQNVDAMQEAIQPLVTVLESLDDAKNDAEDWTEKGIHAEPVAITPDEVRELQRKRTVVIPDTRAGDRCPNPYPPPGCIGRMALSPEQLVCSSCGWIIYGS